MKSGRVLCFFFLWFLLSTILLETADSHKKKLPKPCRIMVFYFHDILYDHINTDNATSARVGAAPAKENLSNSFGDMIVFDDPITLDTNIHSAPVGRAQGLYMYDSQAVFSAWFAFTVVLNSREHKGSMTIAGADYPISDKYRYFSVVGGTGDFFMARGLTTITTDKGFCICSTKTLSLSTLHGWIRGMGM